MRSRDDGGRRAATVRRASQRRRAQHVGRQGGVRLAQPAPPRDRRAPGVGLRARRSGRRRPDHHDRSRRARGARPTGSWRRSSTFLPSSLARLAERIAPAGARDRGAPAARGAGRRDAGRMGADRRAAAADQGDAALQPGARRRRTGRCRSRAPRATGWPARSRRSTSAAPRSPPTGTTAGFAVVCCMVARLAGSPTDRCSPWSTRIDDATALALETAERLGVTVPVEVWSDDGDSTRCRRPPRAPRRTWCATAVRRRSPPTQPARRDARRRRPDRRLDPLTLGRPESGVARLAAQPASGGTARGWATRCLRRG